VKNHAVEHNIRYALSSTELRTPKVAAETEESPSHLKMSNTVISFKHELPAVALPYVMF